MNKFKMWLRKVVVTLTVTAFTSAYGAEVVSYYHNDLSGSPIMATDANGNVFWKENYQPYGDKLNKQAASTNNKIGFHGKPYDDNTGLSYMGARYYNPLLGRFMEVDPQGVNPEDVHSFNRYAYANNNPYRYVDPDGRSTMEFVALGALATGLLLVSMQTAQQQQQSMVQSMTALVQRIKEVVGNSSTTTLSEAQPKGNAEGGSASNEGNSNAPPVPGNLVGSQDNPRAGPRKGGTSHTSGPLTPENGGTGDFGKDLEKLTGGTRPAQTGDSAPPGSLIGGNGIFGRPKNSSGGASIDIPANGNKPHETLHYP